MNDDDGEFRHPALGELRASGEHGWLGRSGPGSDFFDLLIMHPDAGDLHDAPPAAALSKLARVVGEIEVLKTKAVHAICAARQARLNWRAGPAAEAWSIVEARIDGLGDAWLCLHEYETDEYSRWLVRLGTDGATTDIRRVPALPLEGPPQQAGTPV